MEPVEAAVAVTAGLLTNSTALLAFGFDSVIETTSGAAILWRLLRADPVGALAMLPVLLWQAWHSWREAAE